MSIQVKFFGQLVELAGYKEIQIQDFSDTFTLKGKIISDYPNLERYPFVMAVNKSISSENQKLSDGDEVALLPPFAGG